MTFVIRRWVRTNKNTRQKEHREILIRGRQLTVGRSADQHLLISDPKVQPRHALIEQRTGSRIVIRALTPAGFVVNRKLRKVATLRQGDSVRIGLGAITVEELRPGRPAVLGFGHVEEPDPGEIKNLYMTALSETGLSKSFWSWTLSLTILALFLLIPFSSVVYSSLREPLRTSSVMPSDNVWTSGPLSSQHQTIGQDCNICHASPFRMVRNEQCVACHDTMQHHVDVVSSDVKLFRKMDETRCASCHHEHNKPATLGHPDQRLCTDCHEHLDTLKKSPELLNVADFGKGHPDFRLSLLDPRGSGNDTLWERVKIPPNLLAKTAERSNLKFSHAQHLNPKGIRAPDGDEVLKCENCHRMGANGKRMQPILMEAQCSRCHSLLFDATDPNTKVPHGELKVVFKALREHFSREFFEPTRQTVQYGSSFTGRRRPGGTALMTPNEQLRASDWIEQRTLETARQLLEKRLCVDCHQIEKVPGATDMNQWVVNPVRLTDEWMPMARFDHASHSTSPCVTCHKNAEQSRKASEILMPAISVCRDCHGGALDKQKLASDCLMCHQFHLPNRGLFDADATQRMKAVLTAKPGAKRRPLAEPSTAITRSSVQRSEL